jgi:hypothetical protein
MKFPEYVKQQVNAKNKGSEQKTNKTQFLKEFSVKCGVAFATLTSLERGLQLVRYDKAKQVSDATGNKVTIRELCEK